MSNFATPSLVTIPNVPLIEVGIEWPAMTGPITVTREHLVDAAAAAQDPGIPSPKLKLTQMKDTHGTPITEPSFGRITNMRFDESDQTLYGDYEGVPSWLAEVLPAAYPSRSVEIYWGVDTPTGGQWKAVIGAVQLLGVEWPGITTLEDLPLYYGKEQPETVVLNFDAARIGERMTKVTSASVNVDDVRRGYYDMLDEQGNWAWWIKAVLLDPDQLVVEDEWEGALYLVDFTINSDGSVDFGDPVSVKVEYVPVPETTAASATVKEKREFISTFAAGMVATRSVLAYYATRADSGRATKASKEGQQMDDATRKSLALLLGLPETATEEQVNAKLVENALKDPEENKEGDAVVDNVVDLPVAAKGKLPEGVVTIDAEMLKQLQEDAKLGRTAHATMEANTKESTLDEAVKLGKFPPSRRSYWSSYWDKDPEGAKASIAELSENFIPVEERGHGKGGDNETKNGGFSGAGPAYPENWLPEVANRKARLAADAARGSRVFSEAV